MCFWRATDACALSSGNWSGIEHLELIVYTVCATSDQIDSGNKGLGEHIDIIHARLGCVIEYPQLSLRVVDAYYYP